MGIFRYLLVLLLFGSNLGAMQDNKKRSFNELDEKTLFKKTINKPIAQVEQDFFELEKMLDLNAINEQGLLQDNPHDTSFSKMLYLGARASYGSGRYDQAVSLLKVLISDEDTPLELKSRAAYDLGENAMQNEAYFLARSYFNKGFAWGYQKAETKLHNIKQLLKMARINGMAAFLNKDYNNAIHHLEIYETNNPGDAEVIAKLGTSSFLLGHKETANYWWDLAKARSASSLSASQEILIQDLTGQDDEFGNYACVRELLADFWPALEEID